MYMQAEYHTTKFRRFKKKATAIFKTTTTTTTATLSLFLEGDSGCFCIQPLL